MQHFGLLLCGGVPGKSRPPLPNRRQGHTWPKSLRKETVHARAPPPCPAVPGAGPAPAIPGANPPATVHASKSNGTRTVHTRYTQRYTQRYTCRNPSQSVRTGGRQTYIYIEYIKRLQQPRPAISRISTRVPLRVPLRLPCVYRACTVGFRRVYRCPAAPRSSLAVGFRRVCRCPAAPRSGLASPGARCLTCEFCNSAMKQLGLLLWGGVSLGKLPPVRPSREPARPAQRPGASHVHFAKAQ